MQRTKYNRVISMKKDVSIENWILGGTVFILIFTIGCFAWFQYQMSIIEQYDNKDKMKPQHTKEITTYPFIVECYEHTKCRGKKVTILQTTENLQDSLDRAGFEGSIASVRIVKGPDCTADGGEVTFYENPNFTGVTLPCDLGPKIIVEEIPDYKAQILSIRIDG